MKAMTLDDLAMVATLAKNRADLLVELIWLDGQDGQPLYPSRRITSREMLATNNAAIPAEDVAKKVRGLLRADYQRQVEDLSTQIKNYGITL